MVSAKFDTTEVDREIAELRKQHAALDTLSKSVIPPPGGGPAIDWVADAAMGLIDKKLRVLNDRRTRILAGEPDEQVRPRAQSNPVPRDVRRFTKEGEERKQPEIDSPLDGEMLEELNRLRDKYFDADALERTEDVIFGSLKMAREGGLNRPVTFTQALYVALLIVITRQRVDAHATAEFQRNRRRELEARIVALEARPSMQYEGVYDPERQYAEGNVVTHKGSAWVCNVKVSRGRIPDEASDAQQPRDWRLIVKRGQNGRDADNREGHRVPTMPRSGGSR